jgi:hypothetical protein
MESNNKIEAIELFRRVNKNTETAKILDDFELNLQNLRKNMLNNDETKINCKEK